MTILQVKKLDVEVLGVQGYTWPVVVTAKFSKQHWRRLMVEKSTLHFLATALVDIPAVSMPNICSLKT
jgi:hypothetical protein